VPTPPKRSRFDGVGIVLAAMFGPPSAGRKGRQKPAKPQSAVIVNALNLSTGCSSHIRRRVSSS